MDTTRRFSFALSAALALAACGGDPAPPVEEDGGPSDAGTTDGGGGSDSGAPDAGPPDSGRSPVPAFRNPVATPDAELAEQALRVMGWRPVGEPAVEYCNDCHTLTRERIRHWRALSDTSLSTCLTDLEVTSDASAAAMLECLRDPASDDYDTRLFGIWSTAAHLPWFGYVVEHGTTTGDPTAAQAALVEAAGMPRDHTPLSQADFDIVAEWFIRGVPALDDVLPADPRPTECLAGVSADVLTHVDAMATGGWGARNATAGMLMYGCAGAATPADCLATEPLARDTSFGATWENVTGGVPGAHLRVLYTTDYQSSYWTRSSADGRFVAHGAERSPNLRFIDLQRNAVVGSAGQYDPFFFPDDSGFILQGASGGGNVCEMRVLTTGAPTMLTLSEPGCSSGFGIGLYEHAGASLDGSDYWAIDGSAVYDPASRPTLRNPAADFDMGGFADITIMANDGTNFRAVGTERIRTPYEGDAVISPSLGLIVTRLAGATGQLGYVLRRVDATGTGASTSVSTTEIARYCVDGGGKPGFSYDERWITIHRYVTDADAVELGFTGPSDPGFAPYRSLGAANVYMIDLRTGAKIRITNMGPGEYALFPHFRSDGWLYFMVRMAGTPEHVVASDAALLYGE